MLVALSEPSIPYRMAYLVRETFFRPETAVARERVTLPAPLINTLLRLLREGGEPAFIPLRDLQYLAVAERTEVIFVDALGGYGIQDGEGGRLIRLAWRPERTRQSLSEPVACEIIYYFKDMRSVQARLISLLPAAIDQQLKRARHAAPAVAGCRMSDFDLA